MIIGRHLIIVIQISSSIIVWLAREEIVAEDAISKVVLPFTIDK